VKEDLMVRKIISLDEGQEKIKIEAVKQEKLKLESQLKNLILLQTRITDDSLEPSKHNEESLNDLTDDVRRLGNIV